MEREKQVMSFKTFFIIAATISLIIYYKCSPTLSYIWASFRDDTEAYESFLNQFSYGELPQKASDRLYILQEDEIWQKATKENEFYGLQQYINVYPGGKYKGKAKRQIENLYKDWSWVQQQNTIKHYEGFIKRFPNHDKVEWVKKRVIDLEVAQIASSKHGKIPVSQVLSLGGSTVEIKVNNGTGYVLIVRYSGSQSKKIVIPKGGSHSLKLTPGGYRIGASVKAPNVTNYYGKQDMSGGTYSSSFYIQRSFNGLTPPMPDFQLR